MLLALGGEWRSREPCVFQLWVEKECVRGGWWVAPPDGRRRNQSLKPLLSGALVPSKGKKAISANEALCFFCIASNEQVAIAICAKGDFAKWNKTFAFGFLSVAARSINHSLSFISIKEIRTLLEAEEFPH